MSTVHPQRIGVLGGTFDPVHLGHVASAEQITLDFALDTILLVLSARPPHKSETAKASVEDRLAMLRLAVAGSPHLQASDIEVARSGPSYTVDTLRALGRDHPQAELFLVVGIDAWLEVDSWHEPEELLTLAHVVVTTRPGLEFHDTPVLPPVVARSGCWYDPSIGFHVHRSGHRLTAHTIRGIEASSTDIRRRVHEGLAFEHLVPDAVARYIHDRGLYA